MVFLCLSVSLACTFSGLADLIAGGEAADLGKNPPVYVTIALHIEDVPVYANCRSYPDFRQRLLQFAQAIAPYEAAINLQVEYEFLMGINNCDVPALQNETQGQNVLDYLASRYGYEIDAHQEGGWDIEGRDNYADIRFLAGQNTGAISETMGGLVWDDPDQWERLAAGEQAQLYPDFIWHPQVLTLAVSSTHHRGDFSNDDTVSGVWRPAGAGNDFWQHDPQGSIIYIAPGLHDNWGSERQQPSTYEFVLDVHDRLADGRLDQDEIYTASVAVPQSIIFNTEEFQKMFDCLEQLSPLVSSGEIVYANYSRVAQIWQAQYASRPSIYRPDSMGE